MDATVVLSIEVVGALLVMAMLILPGAIGTLSARSMAQILAISIATAVTATVAGMVISNVTNVPPGPGIVLSAFLLFVGAFFLQKFRVRHGSARPPSAQGPVAA